MREALEPIAGKGTNRAPDAGRRLGIFYTGDVDTNDDPLGTIAVTMTPSTRELWRFGDEPDDAIDLNAGRRWVGQLP